MYRTIVSEWGEFRKKEKSTYLHKIDFYTFQITTDILPRQNGFAGRQIRFAWIDQAKLIWNYFRSYLFV